MQKKGAQRKAVIVTHETIAKTSPIVSQVRDRLRGFGFDVTVIDSMPLVEIGEPPAAQVDPDTEIVVVLGGDGTILKAAELVKRTGIPILGINLGHVGFLAEFESFQIDDAVEKIAEGEYRIEERLLAHVDISPPDSDKVYTDWALNDITIEKADRGKMVEIGIKVDDVPLESFSCDGVIVSTPTGSTAYAFSAGGPIIWPGVDALALVPLAAHALFARPLVVGPNSHFDITILGDSSSQGWITCDGRRSRELKRGAKIRICKSSNVLRLATLSGVPFTQRLVTKFDLPVVGWREQGRLNRERVIAQAQEERHGESSSGDLSESSGEGSYAQ
jgi:NAD+ kinase